MAKSAFGEVLRYLHKCALQGNCDLTDRELLERFSSHRDEDAFTFLVRRHGPMVYGVCRRLLRDSQEAEDAFQATFLVLIRRTSSIRRWESLGSWLYRVAQRIALRARAQSAARRNREREASTMEPQRDDLTWQELRLALDEQIGTLSEKYRAPIVLCYLEGKTHDQAARELGCPKSSLSRRLARGRELLRHKLDRRGITLTAGAVATGLAEMAAAAPLPALLTIKTVKAAALLAGGKVVAGGCFSAHVVALAEEALTGMLVAKGKLVVMGVALGLAIGGAGWAGYKGLAETAQPAPAANAQSPVPKKQAEGPAKKDVAMDQYGDPLPEGAVARLGTLRFRHEGEARSIAFSPDGKVLAATSQHGQIYLWDSATGKEVRRLAVSGQGGFSHNVFAIDFSPDGKLVASRWTDQAVRIWEIATGKEVLKITVIEPLPPSGQRRVCFTPDGNAVVVDWWERVGGKTQPRVSFFDTATGKELATWNVPVRQLGSFALSRDGNMFAVGIPAGEPAVEIWDAAKRTKLRGLTGHKSSRAITFSADASVLASGDNNLVVVSDVTTGNVLARLEAPMGFVMGSAFTPDGKTLIAAGQDGKVVFWDLATMKVRLQRDAHMRLIRSMALSADGKTVAVGSSGNAIRVWDVVSGRELSGVPEEPDAPINSIAFAPDSKLLATGGANHEIYLWEVPSGRPRLRLNSSNSANSIAFSRDGKLLATAWHNSQIVRLWDVATGQIAGELKRDGLGARCVAFSPDGQTLVTAHSNLWHSPIKPTSVNFWLVKGGKHLSEYSLQSASLEAIAYAPDGKALAIATGNGTILIWDILAGKPITRLTGHKGSASSVSFSPDGKILASGSKDQTVKLWDPISGKERLSLVGHQRAVTSIAFSPDGHMLSSGSGDPHYPLKTDSPQRIRLWEVATGMEITQLEGHQSDVTALLYSRDGSRLASALRNATVLLWDTNAMLQAPGPGVKLLSALAVVRLWDDLAGADAHKAYQTIWALAQNPDKSIPLLRDRLKPVAAVEAGKIQQWIADLDSEKFAIRQKAAIELEKLGEQAELSIQKALMGKASLETHRRLEQLLKTLQGVPGSTTIRNLRAIMVLERIGSLEAQGVLESLARGAPGARETEEAKASLERLAPRVGKIP